MKRVLMLATTAAMIEQFNKNNIELLNDMGYIVDVAGNFREGNPISEERLEAFRRWITKRGGDYYHLPTVRRPTAFGANRKAYRMVVGLLRKHAYSFVHVHTPIGSIIGRLAAHKTQTKIIYTAHGFHFYKGAPFKNWLLYYPAEWLCSWWTDVLITINQEDYQLARKHMHARRSEYVPGVGVDTEKMANVSHDNNKKRKELGVSENAVLLLSVGELNANKNQSVVIQALAELHNENIHYLICGQGELLQELMQLVKDMKVQEQVHFLGFRNDVFELYHCSDIFVLPSKREGLSVALMEAMASGLPVICSKIRGNVDLVENEKGGLHIQLESVKEAAAAIQRMCTDIVFRRACGEYNLSAIKEYDAQNCNQIMKKIYQMQENCYDMKRETPKKVLHFLKTGEYSGAEKVAIAIIGQMKKRYGYDGVYVSVSGAVDEILRERNICHEVIEKNSKACYQQAINKYQPDIIHAHDFGTSAIIARCKSNALKISHLHNNPLWLKHVNLKSIAYVLSAQKFDFILAVSGSVFEEYIFSKWINRRKLVIGNPINCEEVRIMAERAHRYAPSDVLFLGRISAPKNPQRFIRIIGRVKKRRPDIFALMIGQGDLEEQCRNEIEALQLCENIKLLGFMKNPHGYLKNTKILCVPSDWEGFGLVVAEAFALGIPVVAAPVGGMKNLVNGEGGKLCHSDEEFAEEIIRLLSDIKYYKKKSQEASDRADALDNTDDYMQIMHGIYQGKRG